MRDKSSTLRFGGIYSKTTHSNDFVITNPSDEALICLDCDPKKKCKGNCDRFKQEKRKLRGRGDGK